MFYRIRIDLAFSDQGPWQGLKGHALGVFDQAVTINPGSDNEEKGHILLEKCYHDQQPAIPCEVTEKHLTP